MVVVPSGRRTKAGKIIWRAERPAERQARQAGYRAAPSAPAPTPTEPTTTARTSVAYGGISASATSSQIAKAKAEGKDYYSGGVRYSSTGARVVSATPSGETTVTKAGVPQTVSRAEFEKIKAAEVQKRALELAAKIREKKAPPTEVLFTPKAFAVAKKVLEPSREILAEPELREAVRRRIEAPRIAKIIPDVPKPKEAITIPLYKPEGLVVTRVKPKRKITKAELKAEAFERRVKTLREKEVKYFEAPYFKKMEVAAAFLTEPIWKTILGPSLLKYKPTPIEERGLFPAAAQKFVEYGLVAPGAVLGTVWFGAQRIAATGEALAFGRREVPGGYVQVRKRKIAEEFVVGAPLRLKEEVVAMPTYEKLATGAFIAVAPLIGGPVIMKAKTLAAKAKTLKKMPPARRTRALRDEQFARELQRVQPTVKRIDLVSTERLPPKAAKVTEKFLLEKKREFVVGGQVAARTQTYVTTRRPHDVDVYTKGSPKQAARELEIKLKKAGVERVSRVGTEITIKGKKAVEFHEISKLKANIREVIPPWMPTSVAITKTPRGIRVLKLGVQARRKVIAGYYEGRPKDIPDFARIKESLKRTKELQKKPSMFVGKKGELLLGRGEVPLVEPKVLKRTPTVQAIGKVGELARARGDYYISYRKPKVMIKPYPTYKERPYKPIAKYPTYKPVIKEIPYVPYKPEIKPYPTYKPEIKPYPTPKPISELPYKITPIKKITPYKVPYPARTIYPKGIGEVPYPTYITEIPTPTKRRVPPLWFPLPKPGVEEKKRRKRLLPFGREYGYSPSLSWVLGGRGIVATPAQRVGKIEISPLMIRALPRR